MTPLTLTYRKNGYDYAQVERKGDVAIYAQYNSGKVIAYEVFEILKQKEWEAFGKVYPEKEAMPGTESWGTNAFTCTDLESAQKKVIYLQARLTERLLHREAPKMPIAAIV